MDYLREGKPAHQCLKITCFTPHKLKVLLLPSEYHNITLTLVLMGKFGVLASEGILHLLTGELSPTVIRNTMLSSAALFSRVGSSVAPYLLQLGEIFGITITPPPPLPQQKNKRGRRKLKLGQLLQLRILILQMS